MADLPPRHRFLVDPPAIEPCPDCGAPSWRPGTRFDEAVHCLAWHAGLNPQTPPKFMLGCRDRTIAKLRAELVIEEPGTSLRAAGFALDGLTREQSWDRPSRSRSQELSQVQRWVRVLEARRGGVAV